MSRIKYIIQNRASLKANWEDAYLFPESELKSAVLKFESLNPVFYRFYVVPKETAPPAIDITKLKRFTFKVHESGKYGFFRENPNGDWVSFVDLKHFIETGTPTSFLF
jgi:hypothetical protein